MQRDPNAANGDKIALSRTQHAAGDDAELEPTAVAKAIDEHAREQAYDQVIVGYLLQIAQEIKVTQGKEAAALQRRVSKMVSALNPDTLKRLLEMGGDTHQRRRFVLDAAQGMTVEAVVDLVKAAADAEGQSVSNSFIRMLSKLAVHARADVPRDVRPARERLRPQEHELEAGQLAQRA
jgi:inner membrane protein involved in colicin E2 resistance